MRQEMQDQLNWVLTGFFVNINHHTLELSQADIASLQNHGSDISNAYHVIVTPRAEKPGLLAGIGSGTGDLQKSNAKLVLHILGKIEESCIILEDPKRFTTAKVNVNALKLMYRLNDFSVGLLAALEKHSLISDEFIRGILNDRYRGKLIFNWTSGVHVFNPAHFQVLYMSIDFRLSMKSSPSTHLIHGLLKHLDSVTWKNLERSCLDAQLTGISLDPELEEHMASFKQLIQLRNEFMALTSPAVERLTDHAFQGHIHQVLQDLIRRIFSTVDGEALDHYLIRIKLSYNVLRFLIEYCVKPSSLSEEYMRKLRKLADFPKLQALETYMIEYSDILQKAYVELCKTLQRSPDRDLTEKYGLELLDGRYLVDMDKAEQPLLISLGKNQDTNMQTPKLESLEIINELKKEIELVSNTLGDPNQHGVESQAKDLAFALGIY
ncbi:hypothetical protein PGT21_023095 [Puccinia graminis f. sp. tritici]|uniref:Uncharacterized protein n=2 Tax=Puccinia graminis f. sp. tritici TaxID=56615 RepID=H6QQH6_PUCGT|nr:uncharacterized protein PGTG_21184 [Puccinia graminis f. sp. tritici CRL 75-36-700-3]EHS62676.1 hypothetical protein PGTG_21184 [Puccinia graminis f. sp. tritici CRL 75-36-700-3]KAA1087120.1 hypothetical protein PGT21_023095 [Puccinia graminis f. sp. tritici]